VQRAMVLACPNERAAWSFEEQFMLGDSLLVAPCLSPGGDVEVYLPASLSAQWKRFPSGQTLSGGCSHKLKLALNEIAVFVPDGHTIPMGPDRQYIEKNTGDLPIQSHWPE
jgi:alpha-D-xyloside xylohydrolase